MPLSKEQADALKDAVITGQLEGDEAFEIIQLIDSITQGHDSHDAVLRALWQAQSRYLTNRGWLADRLQNAWSVPPPPPGARSRFQYQEYLIDNAIIVQRFVDKTITLTFFPAKVARETTIRYIRNEIEAIAMQMNSTVRQALRNAALTHMELELDDAGYGIDTQYLTVPSGLTVEQAMTMYGPRGPNPQR